MNITRSLMLAASLVALVVSGCSQPSDLPSPSLEPQFGTVNNDSADYIAANSVHTYIFVAGYSDSSFFLRRYTREGSLVWARRPALDDTGVRKIGTDTAGNVYVYADRVNDGTFRRYLIKINKAGSLLWRKDLGQTPAPDQPWCGDTGYVDCSTAAVTFDRVGNLYIATDVYDSDGTLLGSFLQKYSSGGALLWDKVSGSPSGGDSWYTWVRLLPPLSSLLRRFVPHPFLTKFAPDGTQLWELTSEVMAIYRYGWWQRRLRQRYASNYETRSFDPILLKYDTSGRYQWQRKTVWIRRCRKWRCCHHATSGC
jgi:hypothetical protein